MELATKTEFRTTDHVVQCECQISSDIDILFFFFLTFFSVCIFIFAYVCAVKEHLTC